MTTLFRLDASIRDEGSVSRAVASSLETAILDELHGATVVHREVGLTPLPSTAWPLAVGAGFVPEEQRSPEQREAVALTAELAAELLSADAYIFAVPLYNFGISQHVKTWIDLLVASADLGPGSTALAGRPAFLVVARGGGYGPGTPREGWDHATGWLLRILADVWGLDVQVIETELTLADVNPAMAELRELAAENLHRAHHAAREHGSTLVRTLTAVPA